MNMDILADHWPSFLVVFGVAFGIALTLTPLMIRFGHRWGILAYPAGRRQHDQPTPLVGGFSVVVAFMVAILIAQVLPVERTDSREVIRLTGLIVGGLFIYIVGFFDDKYELSPLILYIAQIIAAAIAVIFLIFIESFNNPFTGTLTGWPYGVTVIISLFWLGLMMNTVNWMDGLDGLATGVGAIASFMIFVHATFELEQVSVGLLALALTGATLGFLPFNFHPARVFLGGGAVFLGFTLGVLSIIGGAKMATILLVMGLPLTDLWWQIIRRVSQGKNPMYGDRGHIHFRLVDMGFSQRQIVIGYYIFSAAFGAIALITASRLFKFIALLVMIGLVAGGFALVNWRTSRQTALPVASDERQSEMS
jgi:UDP-GlcNAc:undecaprenyl-phosphate GlcNAc-1-phosphate transferase